MMFDLANDEREIQDKRQRNGNPYSTGWFHKMGSYAKGGNTALVISKICILAKPIGTII